MHAVEPYPGRSPFPSPGGGPAPVAPRVLVVATEGGCSALVEALRGQGLAVLLAPDESVVQQVESGAVDLVLLHTDGPRAREDLALLRTVSAVPVVVALREARVSPAGFLESGADDCVASNVTRTELAARIRAVLRRRQRPAGGEVLRSGDFVMDLARHLFLYDGTVVHLPPKEFGLLELMLRRDGRVVSREEALELVWGHRQDNARGGDPTTVDVHVKRLRSKVELDPANPEHLLTVRGLGYRFEP
ncbi:MAG: two component transcriptional regulator, winged helix family [Frankiales bacterium]|nr:two component transcriptional regulator, winged helix family [Frankiales bacterium]